MIRSELACIARATVVLIAACVVTTGLRGQTAPSDVLPPVAPPPPAPAIKAFQIEGETVFKEDKLQALLKPFIGQELTIERLEEARRMITQHYIDQGYINSG